MSVLQSDTYDTYDTYGIIPRISPLVNVGSPRLRSVEEGQVGNRTW